MITKLTCPYCGNVFDNEIELSKYSQREVVYCDVDDSPGCDRMFVIEYVPKIQVSYYKVVERDPPYKE